MNVKQSNPFTTSLGILLLALLMSARPVPAVAATLSVPAGGDLQAAINTAQPGDTILLAPGATYSGNFVLPVHGGTTFITIRSAASDALLPAPGTRISPAYSPYLPRIQSPNTSPALRLAPGAAYWRLQLLEFLPTLRGMYDILSLGDGSSAQNTLAAVPHHLIVDRVYLHGDPLLGQKRGIGLNSAYTTIANSYVADIKAAGQDSQAIAGWNGPGPYNVENNYLEASGNIILIGGDDPKIANLVGADMTFRGNTLTRPVAWREAIVPTPALPRVTVGSGNLPAGTYGYRVAARRIVGSSVTVTSAASAEIKVTTGAGASVAISWTPVADVKDYVVYGRTPGAENMYWVTTATSVVDGGSSAGTSGTPPAKGTVWTVKNLFELKNARRVQVDYNLMENNWAQAQTGYAVLFTVRNQNGGCTWCVVEDVTFERNVVRHMGGGVSILGWDDNQPSQQTNNIRIRHNEFSDYGATWGGTGYFMQLVDQPRDITLDHNTLVSGSGYGLALLAGVAPMSGIVITNNVAKHDDYGILGDAIGIGNVAIAYYMPNAVVTRNVLAGGRASDYPAGNLAPTVDAFQGHFVNYAAGDFALIPGTDWAGAGTDGLDLGADMAALRTPRLDSAGAPPAILTTSLPSTTEGLAYTAAIQGNGGRTPYRWQVYAGSLPPGIALDALTGVLSGAAASAGDFAFTIRLTDADGLTTGAPLALRVDRSIAPVSIVTSSLPDATVTVPYAATLAADGGLGTYVWSVSGGQLPAGLSLAPTGLISGTPTVVGTYSVSVTAADASDTSRSATRTFSMRVIPALNAAPTVTLTAPPSPVPLASPVAFTATAFDSDGAITRVEFLVDGVLARSVTAAPFTYTWTATAGDHRVRARAVDDDGAVSTSPEVTISSRLEVVLYATDVKTMVGRYQMSPDRTAADQTALLNPNKNGAMVRTPAASPSAYAEFEFYAEAGRAYHVWIRAQAQKNAGVNDSAYLQFSNVAAARIGTTSALVFELEDAVSAGLSKWGWQDDGVGSTAGVFGTQIVFERSGLQKLRIQPREDGLMLDQVVISPDKYLLVAPGASKDDATIIAK